MLARFSKILNNENLEHRVALVGCFCMDRCGETMNWKLDGQEFASASVEEAEQTLRDKLREAAAGQGNEAADGSGETDP